MGSSSYNIPGYGIHIYDSNQFPSNNIVRNCKIHNVVSEPTQNWMAGILLGRGSGNFAYNNIVRNNGGHGIQIGNQATNSKVYNNTVYQNRESGIQTAADTSGAQIKNNISYLNGSMAIINAGANTTQSNNLTANPLFVNAGAGDFHLQSTSPAIDAGASLIEVADDIERALRPQGNAHDLGACEYRSQSSAPGPSNLRVVSQ